MVPAVVTWSWSVFSGHIQMILVTMEQCEQHKIYSPSIHHASFTSEILSIRKNIWRGQHPAAVWATQSWQYLRESVPQHDEDGWWWLREEFILHIFNEVWREGGREGWEQGFVLKLSWYWHEESGGKLLSNFNTVSDVVSQDSSTWCSLQCQLISNNQVKTLIVANNQTQFVKTLTDVWRLITRIINNVYKHYHHHKYQRLQLTLTFIPSLILSQHWRQMQIVQMSFSLHSTIFQSETLIRSKNEKETGMNIFGNSEFP